METRFRSSYPESLTNGGRTMRVLLLTLISGLIASTSAQASYRHYKRHHAFVRAQPRSAFALDSNRASTRDRVTTTCPSSAGSRRVGVEWIRPARRCVLLRRSPKRSMSAVPGAALGTASKFRCTVTRRESNCTFSRAWRTKQAES
jgi:hypothetical protein